MARPATISPEAVLQAGLELGLDQLSMAAVADRLGVTRAAVYRLVPGRAALEELVGEHLLTAAPPPPAAEGPIEAYLEAFGWWLRDVCTAHPGLADYLIGLFPRTPASGRLMEQVVAGAVSLGWSPPAGMFLSGAVSTTAIALVRSDLAGEAYRAELSDHDPDRLARAFETVAALPMVSQGLAAFEGVDVEERFRWYLRCTVEGALAVARTLEL